MPTGSRIRTDSVFGTVTDNPLTAGAVTLNSAGLVNLAAVVAPDHAIIILDPLRTAGAPEIVIVTAHTAAASSATITRGAYGTTARSHAAGVLWIHSSTIEDAIRIVTSAARPTDPYRGQLVFETDTNSYVGRDTSDAWQTAVPLGAWTAYTPTDANITVGNGVRTAAYARSGRTIFVRWRLVLGSTSAIGFGGRVGLPVASVAVEQSLAAHYLDSGTRNYVGVAAVNRSSTVLGELLHTEAGGNGGVDTNSPFTWAVSDTITVTGSYEAAL